MSHRFIFYYYGTIVKPGKTFGALKEDPRNLRFGFRALLIMAALYSFVYLFLIYGGGQPFKPWLNIPLNEYYRYNVFFCAPSMVLGWILAAGVVQIISRLFSGTGTFEQTLCVLGFGIGIASWSTGFHDLLTSFLGAIHVISQRDYEMALNSPTIWRTLLWIQMLIYLLWFLILFREGVQQIHGLKGWKAALAGTAGFIVYQGFFLIFNR
jgi:hypothetical protein